ncbi:MAG: hypothetical protein IKZ96_00705 [Bacilli bacterium]|nr:hypothetical protein [Bacilli bacterium]
MDYITAAAIYDTYLYNLNRGNGFSLQEIFFTYYQSKGIDPSKREDDFIKFTSMINEAQEAGKRLEEISKYLQHRHFEEAEKESKREETIVTMEDENGNTTGVKIESNAFDPSGKTNISSKLGSGDFEFNDESTKYLNQAKEDALSDSLIAGKAADRKAEDDNKAGKEHIGTRDVIDIPEPLIVGEPVDTLNQGVDSQNVPTFEESSAPASIDNINDPNNFTFGDDDNGPDNQEPDNGLSF